MEFSLNQPVVVRANQNWHSDAAKHSRVISSSRGGLVSVTPPLQRTPCSKKTRVDICWHGFIQSFVGVRERGSANASHSIFSPHCRVPGIIFGFGFPLFSSFRGMFISDQRWSSCCTSSDGKRSNINNNNYFVPVPGSFQQFVSVALAVRVEIAYLHRLTSAGTRLLGRVRYVRAAVRPGLNAAHHRFATWIAPCHTAVYSNHYLPRPRHTILYWLTGRETLQRTADHASTRSQANWI